MSTHHLRTLDNIHERHEGSDLLCLIRDANASGFPQAVAWALGTRVDHEKRQPQATRPTRVSDAEVGTCAAEPAGAQADHTLRLAHAVRIAADVVPLEGRLGERYLSLRNIGAPQWPASIENHPACRALVAVATATDGSVRAVQRVHLAEDGQNVGAAVTMLRRLLAVQVTVGVTAGAVLRLPGKTGGPLMLAEGLETGLAVYTSDGHETWIELNSVAQMTVSGARKVVILSDDRPPEHDARHAQAPRSLAKATPKWRNAGIDVVVATPWQTRRRNRSELADVIVSGDVDAIRARISAALTPTEAPTERLSVDQARQTVARAVWAFSAELTDSRPSKSTEPTGRPNQRGTPQITGRSERHAGAGLNDTPMIRPLGGLRLERSAERLHALGPRTLAELLAELVALDDGAFVLDRLAAYGRLQTSLLRRLGADRFAPRRLCLVPGDGR